MLATSAAATSSIRVLPSRKKVKIGNATVVDGSSSTPVTKNTSQKTQMQAAPQQKSNIETVQTPDITTGPFEEAMALYRANNYQDAYRKFEQVLAGNPQGKKAAED